MRTFLTFLACSGFIVWAHSCDTRILGVNPTPAKKETSMAKRSEAPPSSSRQQYLKQLFSAAALTMVGSNPQLYLVSFRYLASHHYLSPKADTLMTRLRPRYQFASQRQ